MAGDVSTSQSNLSAPISGASAPPNMSDYMSVNRFLNNTATFDDVGIVFWDLITGGQASQLQKAQYDNAYNEYLYNRYQSPAALARQLEEAGLNRNFAQQGPSGSIQGAASANLSNNGIANSINIVKGVNTLIGSVLQGVNLIKSIKSMPDDLAFKRWRNILTSQNADIASNRALSALSQAYYDSIYYGGRNIEGFSMNGEDWNPMNSKAITQAGLRNDVMELTKGLRKYQQDYIQPQEYKRLVELTNRIGQQAKIDAKTLEYFDANTILPFIFAFLKMFL